MSEFFLDIPTLTDGTSVENMQLPDSYWMDYWNLATKRFYCIDGEIIEATMEIQKEILIANIKDIGIPKEKRKPIIILINSNGGLLDVTNAIIDTILASTTPVYTVNVGEALSGGALIFLAGEKRFCFKSSYAMLHSGSGGVSGTYEQQKEAGKVYDEQVKEMQKYIIKRTGIDSKIVNRNKNKDWYFNANQQLEYNVATNIIESLDEIIFN